MINHFFIYNVSGDRARNLCLSKYTVEPDPRASTLTYVLKPTSYQDVDMTLGSQRIIGEKTHENLTKLLAMKPLYTLALP